MNDGRIAGRDVQGDVVPVHGVVVVLQSDHSSRLVVRAEHPEVELTMTAADRCIAGKRKQAAVVSAVMPHGQIGEAILCTSQLDRVASRTAPNSTLRMRQFIRAITKPLPIARTKSQVRAMTEIAETTAVAITANRKLIKRLLDESDVSKLFDVALPLFPSLGHVVEPKIVPRIQPPAIHIRRRSVIVRRWPTGLNHACGRLTALLHEVSHRLDCDCSIDVSRCLHRCC